MLPLPPALCVTQADSWLSLSVAGVSHLGKPDKFKISPPAPHPGSVKAPHLDTKSAVRLAPRCL